MTQIPSQSTLSDPGYPRIMLMVTESLVDTVPNTKGPSMFWRVGAAHPFVPEMSIVAMFVAEGVVEVYSANPNSKSGMRDLVPAHCTRLLQEAMPFSVFAEELAHAEAGDDDDEEFDDPDPDDEVAPLHFDPSSPAIPPNGQAES